MSSQSEILSHFHLSLTGSKIDLAGDHSSLAQKPFDIPLMPEQGTDLSSLNVNRELNTTNGVIQPTATISGYPYSSFAPNSHMGNDKSNMMASHMQPMSSSDINYPSMVGSVNDTNAFASSSGDTAPAAASLIASTGLGGLVNPGTLATTTPSGSNMPGLYSTTGFDIVGILAKVASRKDPKTALGPVDFSCSFIVSDVRKYDCPVVYCSPTFCQLTGYESREIIGRNCRFLQSPDGEVVKGSRRRYTDNVAVGHMKRLLLAGKECQASLINYRKGGTPL